MSDREPHHLLPTDSAWLTLETPRNPLTITIMMRVDGLTEERLRRFLARYWLAWERFRCFPEQQLCGWCWVPARNFSLDDHIECITQPMPELDLEQWVSARLNQPLASDRPRWKFWLVPGMEAGAVLLLRIHHCYGDGTFLRNVFDCICTPGPDTPPAACGAPERFSARQWLNTALGCLHWSRARAPVRGNIDSLEPPPVPGSSQWQKMAMASMRVVNEVSQLVVEPEDSVSPLKRPLLGRRHCRWSAPVALSRFQRAARVTGCTINDLLLACVAAAMRARGCSDGMDPEDLIMHAAVPVDIRGQLPAVLSPAPGAPGNYFGTVFVPLSVDGGCALERLYRIKHETRRLKRSLQPAIGWGLSGLASLLPASLREPVADLFYRKASAVVSNVRGTAEHRYLAGCRVSQQMFWVPQAGDIGLGVSIVSYAGQVQFGVVADEAVLDDPREFLDHCLAELDRFPH